MAKYVIIQICTGNMNVINVILQNRVNTTKRVQLHTMVDINMEIIRDIGEEA